MNKVTAPQVSVDGPEEERGASGGDPWANIQPYYVAYCKAHGAKSPDEMRARDRERFPGGPMAGYLIWNQQQWREWTREKGWDRDAPLGAVERAEFGDWLAAKYGAAA